MQISSIDGASVECAGSEPRPGYFREVVVPEDTDGQLDKAVKHGASFFLLPRHKLNLAKGGCVCLTVSARALLICLIIGKQVGSHSPKGTT